MLIPLYGSMGATIGTVAAEMVVCCVQMYCVRNELKIGSYLRIAFPFFILGIIMFIPVYTIGNSGFPSIDMLVKQVVVGAFIYLIGSILYLSKIKDEIVLEMIHRIVHK